LLNNILKITLFLFVLQPGFSKTIHIPADLPTIQMGIIRANHGDTILVAPGRYYENIVFTNKEIVVASHFIVTGDTSYISQTIIDGSWKERVITFEEHEDSNTVLSGFTITHGYARDVFFDTGGGGIFCDFLTGPRLEHLKVCDNYADFGGGGIFCYALSSPKIYCTEIFGNCADRGGGIYFEYETKPVVENVSIHHNTVSRAGGGVYIYSNSDILLKNITLYNNIAQLGGGIHCYDCSPLILNGTIVNNAAYLGGGLNCGQLSSPKIVNTILWDNWPQEISFSDLISSMGSRSVAIACCDVKDGNEAIYLSDDAALYWLEGNISSDPFFINSTLCNFNLKYNSDCIDRGIQDTLLSYNDNQNFLHIPSLIYQGAAPDIGAFEFKYPLNIKCQSFLPTEFKLEQNYPNPFNLKTSIGYTIPENGQVKIAIYDLSGKLVKILLNRRQLRGTYRLEWNGEKDSGIQIASGLYFLSMDFNGKKRITKRMILLK
jgi:hypothetical protein